MRMIRNIAVACMIAVMGMSTAACVGKRVPAGYVGVMVNNYGDNGGVQKTPLPTRWHFTGWGQEIFLYPTTQKVYSYTRDEHEGHNRNEEIQFNDLNGLQMAGDLALTVRIDPAKAPYIYEKYRLDVDELINGPLRTSVRSAIKQEAHKYTSEQIYTGGDAQILQGALVNLQNRWDKEGIEIIALDWINNLRYPDVVVAAITQKTTNLQKAEAAKADQTRAEAQAQASIAQARGEAESTRIKAEAISANPQILQQMWIEKWNGRLPETMAGGQGTFMMVNPK